MIADTAPDLSLAIVTLVGTIATGVIALVGTLISSRTKQMTEVANKLDAHLDEAAGIKGQVAAVQAALDEHVRWEMTQKYGPWDGMNRRGALPPPGHGESAPAPQ